MYDRKAEDMWEALSPYVTEQYKEAWKFQEECLARRQQVLDRVVSHTFMRPAADLQTLQMIHAALYGDLLNNAGQVGEHTKLEDVFANLHKRGDMLFRAAGTRQEKARAIAAYHAEIVRLRPFLICNGVVARILSEATAQNIMGEAPQEVLGRGQYLKGRERALERGDLGGLAYALTHVVLPKDLRRDYRPELREETRKLVCMPCGEELPGRRSALDVYFNSQSRAVFGILTTRERCQECRKSIKEGQMVLAVTTWSQGANPTDWELAHLRETRRQEVPVTPAQQRAVEHLAHPPLEPKVNPGGHVPLYRLGR